VRAASGHVAAARERDEIAASQLIEMHSVPAACNGGIWFRVSSLFLLTRLLLLLPLFPE
jgi:hypothetical protein